MKYNICAIIYISLQQWIKSKIFFVAANLAIVIAAKVGLYTLILAIALVAASVKIALMMAWASTIYKYVPDPYRYKSDHRPYDPYNKVGYEKQGYETFDALADLITNRKGHWEE